MYKLVVTAEVSCNYGSENLIVNISKGDYENIFDNLFDDIWCSTVSYIVIYDQISQYYRDAM